MHISEPKEGQSGKQWDKDKTPSGIHGKKIVKNWIGRYGHNEEINGKSRNAEE